MAYKYTIDGKVYRSETPLTDDELEELASAPRSIPQMPATPAAPASQPSYLAEAARRGPASTAGLLTGLGRTLTDTLTQLGINPITLGSRAANLPTTAPAPTAAESFAAGRAATYDPLMRLFGSTGAQPTTMGERIVAGGVQAATSPESYLFGPLSWLGRTGPVARTVLGPVEQAIVGAGGEAGGIVGEIGGEKVGAPTAGRVVGSLFGGAGTAGALNLKTAVVPVAGKAWNFAKSKVDKLMGVEPKDELLRDVNTRINNVFIAAAAADPKFMTTLEEAAKAQTGVSLKAPGGANVQMPLSALLADNPVINSFIQNLASKDPLFKAQYGAQYQAAKDALRQNQVRLFGDPSKVQLNVQPTSLEKPLARQVKSIDQQIADLAADRTVDANEFGQRVAALVAKKEESARNSTKPLYTEAFKIADDKGVTLPAGAVDDIYNFVAGSQASDIFKTFPSIYNRVRSRFRPTETQPSPILTAEGAPMAPGGQQFAAASVQDLDSLKREINRQLRKTSEPADIRLLTELKARVNGHIDNLDPDFVNAYKNADKAYFERVGLPFTSETLKSVDRKRFVEQIVPAIIGNKSNVDEFIRATGEDGVRVARDAFYDSFTKAALKGDAIDPRAANKWLAKNAGAVSLVPGLGDELRGAVNNTQALLAKRTAMENEFRRVAGEQLIRKEGFTSPQELVNKMYGDSRFTEKFMSNAGYGQNKDAVNAIRAFMLDDLVRSSDPVSLLADRTKAGAFNRVFGPTYAKKVSDFVTVSDRLQKDISQVSFRGETVPRTPIEELTGIPPEQIISRIYNPVSGPVYAVTSMFSKYWANAASRATEEKLKQLLLNPSDAIKVFNAIEAQGRRLDPEKLKSALEVGKKYGINWVNDAAADVRSGAQRGALRGMQPQEVAPMTDEETMMEQ
jgi:hypothetical protein